MAAKLGNIVAWFARATPPAAIDARSRHGLQVVLAGASVMGALWLWIHGGFTFPLDDAYITLHHARVLLDGRDPNYGVPALVGATSPLHLALTTAASAVTGSAMAGDVLVAVLGLIAYLLGLVALAARRALSLVESLLLVVIGAGSGYASVQLFNGLETAWAMAAVTWALVLASGDRPGRMLPLLCGLMPFVRPELAVLSLGLLVRQTWLRLQAGERPAAAIATDAALALLAAAPWLAWTFTETGAVLPATSAAKQAYFAEAGAPLLDKVRLVGTALVVALGPAVLALVVAPRTALTATAWAFVLAVAAAFVLTFPGGIAHNDFRYAYVLLPVCAWALAAASQTRPFRLLLVVCAVCAAASIPRAVAACQRGQALTRDGLGVAAWAQANLPAGSRVLVHDAGAPAFASSLKLIDVVGLKTPDSMAAHRRFTAPTGGAGRAHALDEIAQRSHATHAIVLDDADHFWGRTVDDLRTKGWRLTPLHRNAARSGYVVYALTPTLTISTSPPATVATSPTRLPSTARAKGET